MLKHRTESLEYYCILTVCTNVVTTHKEITPCDVDVLAIELYVVTTVFICTSV